MLLEIGAIVLNTEASTDFVVPADLDRPPAKSATAELAGPSCSRTTVSMTDRESRRAINAARGRDQAGERQESSILFWQRVRLVRSERMCPPPQGRRVPVVTTDSSDPRERPERLLVGLEPDKQEAS